MKHISASLLTYGVTLLFTSSVAPSAHAETKIVHEVEGKEASLALLKFQMLNHSGEFCAAKRAELVLQEDDPVSASAVTRNKRDIPEASVLEVARSLSGNENVTVFYCEGSGDDLVATGTSVSHVVWKKTSNWTASVMKSGKSITAADPSGSETLTDAEVAQTLAEASRQMNAMLPMEVSKGVRFDSTVVSNKVLLHNYTLVDREASAVNAEDFRRGVKSRIVPGVCKEEKNRVLFQSGVRYRYRYHGKAGKEITTITVASSDCK